MKTTIDLPDDLYRRAKIKAVERSTTLKELLVSSLAEAVAPARRVRQAASSTSAERWSQRRLVSGYSELRASRAFAAGTDSAAILDEERGSR